MGPAQVDPLHAMAVGGQGGERVDAAREQDTGSRIRLPFGEPLNRFGDGGEAHLDMRGHPHAIQVLLPVARAHRVVDEHDEAHVERLPPTHDHLAVNQTVVYSVEHDAHAAGVRMALLPASPARRAASRGGRSRWNTKSSSIARLTPVRSEEHTSELQSPCNLVCRLLLEKKKKTS